MAYCITINDHGSYSADRHDSLLEAGQRAGFGFPHACRNGNCERCLAHLEEGAVRHPQHITERLLRRHNQQALLCCQASPLTDCQINMPAVTGPHELPIIEKTCQKVSLNRLSPDVSLLKLRLPAGLAVQWHAGQYVKIRLANNNWLPFSLANPPSPGERDLCIHFQHLPYHHRAQQHLAWFQQHDLLRVKLPFGNNCLSSLPQRPVWFICGATGFAPAHAMLRYLAQHQYQGELRLFWGVREARDIYLPDAPAALARQLPGLQWDIVLSADQHPDYHSGLPHELAIQCLSEPTRPLIFISGSPAMAEAVHQALQHSGVSDAQIRSDMLALPNTV